MTASSTSLVDRLDGLLVDERADVGAVVLAAAEGECTHPVGELLGELVGDRGVHEEPVGGGAGLAHVAHLGEHRAVDGRVDVGVLEDQERRVAAELHADPLQLVGGLLDQQLADPGGAGEADLAQPRVGHDRGADLAGAGSSVTTLSTPSGSPASANVAASASIVSGVCCAGLTTIVQPAATAGPILRVPMASGKFHGRHEQARARPAS